MQIISIISKIYKEVIFEFESGLKGLVMPFLAYAAVF